VVCHFISSHCVTHHLSSVIKHGFFLFVYMDDFTTKRQLIDKTCAAMQCLFCCNGRISIHSTSAIRPISTPLQRVLLGRIGARIIKRTNSCTPLPWEGCGNSAWYREFCTTPRSCLPAPRSQRQLNMQKCN
jgi:hypothetical protein